MLLVVYCQTLHEDDHGLMSVIFVFVFLALMVRQGDEKRVLGQARKN
jgi:hypothetical protein